MSALDFDNDEKKAQVLYGKFQPGLDRPWIINMLLNKNIAKTETSANIMLLAAVLICIVVAIFLYRSNIKPTPTVEDVIKQSLIEQN